MRRIIVIGGGRHHNALGVIRSLGEAGFAVELITVGNGGAYIANSKYVTKHHALRNWTDIVTTLNERSIKVCEKECVISCADPATEQLNLHLDELDKRYIIPGVPQQSCIVSLMDKTTMIAMAAQQGIKAPQIWSLPADRQRVTFPCITKSYVSSHGVKSDIIICRESSELDTFMKNNTDEVFVQEYIDKEEEVQFIGCSLRGGEEVIIPGMTRILRSQPNTNTGFLEYGPITPIYFNTIKQSKAYIRECNYSGLFSIEFMRGRDNQIWFLEINFRNDGNAWCVTKAGINLPAIWAKSCLGLPYRDDIKEPKRILMMPEFNDFKLVLQRKVGLWQWLKDWKRTDYFMEWDKNDKKPFWSYLYYKVK